MLWLWWLEGPSVMTFVQVGLLFAIATPFGLAVWVAWRHRRGHGAVRLVAPEADFQVGVARTCFKAEKLDLGAEVKAVVDSLAEDARERYVTVQFAVVPGSKVHVDWNALWLALRSALRTAIDATPGGNVPVTGRAVGTEMHVVIMDDGPDTEQMSRESLARETEALMALQGGSVAVEARRGHGTTMTIRLPTPRAADSGTHDPVVEATLAREVVG
jgi:hypothetical protein